MSRAREEPLRPEGQRVAAVYEGYARSERKAGSWSAANAGNRAIRAELLRMILDQARPDLSGEAPVLDVGCGTGWCLVALTERGVAVDRLHGVEIIKGRAEATRRRLSGAHVRCADARALPFDDGRFGMVLLLTLLSSMRSAGDVRRAIAEARRVLRPGGLLLCYEPRIPNPLNPHTRLVRLGDFRASDTPPTSVRSLTVAPALARMVTDRVPGAYGALASLPVLRTHRLVSYRRLAEARR